MNMKPLLILLLLLLLLLHLFSFSGTYSIHLIHRDFSPSLFSPNPRMTLQDLLQNAALRSVSRSKRLLRRRHHHDSQSNNNNDNTVIPVIMDGSYIMKLYIGTPALETWAIADTGSDLVWLQCLPCLKCYHQDTPLFDPNKSSTFKAVSCHSQYCRSLPLGHDCGRSSNQCVYYYAYVDGTGSVGLLARDVINFAAQTVSFRGSVFGCGFKNTGVFAPSESGIIGLGNGPFSLVTQLGPQIRHKFSYCLVPFFSNSTSKLKLGEEANISRSNALVVSTPYGTNSIDPYYFLNLQGVTIGNKTVRISSSSENEGRNMIIDCGSTLTYLASSFYKKVEALVREAIGIEAVKNPPDPYSLCFQHHDFASLLKQKLSTFVVHFKDADVSLNPDHNLFVQNLLLQKPKPSLFCFAMVPIEGEISIYGDVAQTNFEVEYDLEARKVSFAPRNCANH